MNIYAVTQIGRWYVTKDSFIPNQSSMHKKVAPTLLAQFVNSDPKVRSLVYQERFDPMSRRRAGDASSDGRITEYIRVHLCNEGSLEGASQIWTT